MQTSSRNGFGTKLLFHRPVGQGLFEATVWVTGLYIPLFPTSTWLVRPLGMKMESTGRGTATTYHVEFLERRSTSLARILTMYFWVACALLVMWTPMVVFFVMLNSHPGMEKTWKGALLLPALIWGIALWVIIENRRDKLYKEAVDRQKMD